MNNFKSYHFLINPVSGKGRNDWQQFIESYKPSGYIFKYSVWDLKEDKNSILQDLKESDCQVLVAVGGDGTVNILSGIALENKKPLGIIPAGSGNGLARHLKIPLSASGAIKRLLHSEMRMIDVASVNDIAFLCTAGVGFDALISHEFAKRELTGLLGYTKKVLERFLTYKPENYKLLWATNIKSRDAYLITFANASQYGNNAYIAPSANIGDGLLDICIVKPFPIYMALFLAMRLFTKSIHNSRYYEHLKVPEITLKRNKGPVHLDGEAFEMDEILRVRILPEKLKILT